MKTKGVEFCIVMDLVSLHKYLLEEGKEGVDCSQQYPANGQWRVGTN